MFRAKYLDHDELCAQLNAWTLQYPDTVRVTSIGASFEGRDIKLLTIGRDPDRARPAVWVDGNMHASEVCGSSVALAIAEDVIGIYQGKDEAGGKPIPSHMADTIRETLFYVVPRISPDGAEAVLKTGRYIRSSPMNDRSNKGHCYWQASDIDGDGLTGFMRQRCDVGEMVELCDEGGVPLAPPVMVRRIPEDTGPFYKFYPEGLVANFDGHRIPDTELLGDNLYDFNRNFPYQWAIESEQAGAGPFPGSAPETRAIIDFATKNPHIFTWLNLHTYGGALLRPMGDRPDSKMDQTDLAIYRQVEVWMDEHTGYPSMSSYHEFLYNPDKTTHGSLSNWAYRQLGCLIYVVELWDLFKQLGIQRHKPFIDHYNRMSRDDFRALAKLDSEKNNGRIFKSWRKVQHPQIGEVEVGGYDPRIGISNPPLEMIADTCAAQSAAFLRVAALVPKISVELLSVEPIGVDQSHIHVRVVNRGYLGSYGMSSARSLPHVEPLRASLECGGVRLLAPASANCQIGHLDGWGIGLHPRSNGIHPLTRGNGHEKLLSFIVQGQGQLHVTVGSCRVGHQTITIDVPQHV